MVYQWAYLPPPLPYDRRHLARSWADNDAEAPKNAPRPQLLEMLGGAVVSGQRYFADEPQEGRPRCAWLLATMEGRE